MREIVEIDCGSILFLEIYALDPDLLDLVLDSGPIRLDLVNEGFLLWFILLSQNYLLEAYRLLLGRRREILGVLLHVLLVEIIASPDTDCHWLKYRFLEVYGASRRCSRVRLELHNSLWQTDR